RRHRLGRRHPAGGCAHFQRRPSRRAVGGTARRHALERKRRLPRRVHRRRDRGRAGQVQPAKPGRRRRRQSRRARGAAAPARPRSRALQGSGRRRAAPAPGVAARDGKRARGGDALFRHRRQRHLRRRARERAGARSPPAEPAGSALDEGSGLRTLRLYLCALAELGADSTLDYEVLDAERAIVRRARAVLAELPRLPRTELVIAAPDVLLVEASLPPLTGARLRAALPAIAEPHLLSELESAYVVAAKPHGGA